MLNIIIPKEMHCLTIRTRLAPQNSEAQENKLLLKIDQILFIPESK